MKSDLWNSAISKKIQTKKLVRLRWNVLKKWKSPHPIKRILQVLTHLGSTHQSVVVLY